MQISTYRSAGVFAKFFLIGIFFSITACVSRTQPVLFTHPTTGVDIARDIPTRQDLVTVIPFQYAAPFESNAMIAAGFILIPGEIDGIHGVFMLDTGAGGFWLNGRYLQPASTGGIDTVRDRRPSVRTPCPRPERSKDWCQITVQTLRLGTLRMSLAAPDRAPTLPNDSTNAFIQMGDQRMDQFGRPVLGMLGLGALDGVETIIDYPHQRVILIRLDSAGRRLADVPAFTPKTDVPLILLSQSKYGFVGVEARLGEVIDTLMIDTGTLWNTWRLGVRPAHRDDRVILAKPNWDSLNDIAAARMTDTLFIQKQVPGFEETDKKIMHVKQLMIGTERFDDVGFIEDGFATMLTGRDILGFAFLRRLGVVGFNFRTRRLLIYHAPQDTVAP